MNKQEFLNYLIPELKRIEEEHVTKLSNEGKYEDVGAIIEQIEKNESDKACEYMDVGMPEKILSSDIPTEYKYAWGIYMRATKYDEEDWMGYIEAEEWIKDLKAQGGSAEIMANALQNAFINEYTSFTYFMEFGEASEVD